MRGVQYLPDGHHVDDAGNLISCAYVDLRDPAERGPITTLRKASPERYAIPGCGTIRLVEADRTGWSRRRSRRGSGGGNRDRRERRRRPGCQPCCGRLRAERLDLLRVHRAGDAGRAGRLAGGAANLGDRLRSLGAPGWTGRDAEWLALVCLHGAVFLRLQYLAFQGQSHPELARRFVRRCGKAAVEERWNASGLKLCRIVDRELYRELGVQHLRPRRDATPAVALRRLLALDYLDAPWLLTDGEKVAAFTDAGVPKDVWPGRVHAGRDGAPAGPSSTGCRWRSTPSGQRSRSSSRRRQRRAPYGLGACSMRGCRPLCWRQGALSIRRRGPQPGAAGGGGRSARRLGVQDGCG